MSTKLRLPKRLSGAATIGICAPSGTVSQQALARAVAFFQEKGHRVVLTSQTAAEWRYFAGPDEERLSAFHELLADPAVDILMAARGGYGWTRILAQLDFEALAKTDKILVGFSDFTAFSLAALAKSQLITFAGPMASVDFGNGNVSPFMEENFWPLLSAPSHQVSIETEQQPYSSQTIEGTIWGSNLSLLAHLVGTPYLPEINDGILFLEEAGEEPYAVERMLFQLHHAGVLSKQKALILGNFDKCVPTSKSRYPYSMIEVVESLRALLPIPVLTGLPFGHVHEKITIPIGAKASVTITSMGFELYVSAYNSI